MKSLLFSMVLVAAALANAEDKSSGCGLGWQVAPRQSLLSSYTRTITNAVTSSTSGMTTGTSGCDRHSIVEAEKAEVHYAEANFNTLMVEMAQGHGEYVNGFASVMGCSDSEFSAFAKSSQQHYPQLFPSNGATPGQLVNGVKTQLKQEGLCNHVTVSSI